MRMLDVIVLIVGTGMAFFWCVLLLVKKQDDEDVLNYLKHNKKIYPGSFFYPVGFNFLRLTKSNMNSLSAKKMINSIAVVEGKKYADFYYYVLKGRQITTIITGIIVSCFSYALLGNGFAILSIIIFGLIAYLPADKYTEESTIRENSIMIEFPRMLSKITLLVKSGMVLRDAWKMVAFENEGVLYEEMQNTVNDINNGMLEVDAYNVFSERCNMVMVSKFTAIITQNLKKGNAEIAEYLEEMSVDVWENKKNHVKKLADAATTKLMFPSLLIFMGILIMILVPMFMEMSKM